ncbi:MAG: GTP cyclohydrolase I FolE [Spirochaetia bacterium]|nr:GTP cyclohydrolase I FolE [Spirochaetia bacterium]
MEKNIHSLLSEIGEDPEREGLIRTPNRVAKAYDFLTSGYRQDLNEILNDALFTEANNGMVIARDIEVYSLCEHHMLPFYGRAHVAYIPRNKVIGLSKIPRIIDMFARRLQVQERLTGQIQETLNEVLEADGVAVVMKCKHMCMMMRGVEKQNSDVVTSSVSGIFQENEKTRMEFLNLINS